MIFKSHFIAMFVFAVIVSIMLAFLKYDEKKEIIRYGLKLLGLMVGAVIAISWIMRWF